MNELVMKLRIYLRAETTLFKADAHRRANQAILAAVSIGCALVALAFVNVGAFFMLTDSPSGSRAAFILAGGNFALALVPLLLRRSVKPGPEEMMVREIREMALEQITKEANDVAESVESIGNTIAQIRSGIGSFAGGGGMGSLGPVLSVAIDLLKKNRGG